MSMIRLSDILLQMVYISYRKLLIVDLRLILKISQRHIPNTNRLTSVPFPISRSSSVSFALIHKTSVLQ
jgi:hypothetical protein